MTINTPKSIYCRNEYDPLKLLATCKPQYMKISKVINETQRIYIKENIDVNKAMKQHEQFLIALRSNGIEIAEIPASEVYPEQVFTRDIGFTIGAMVFISELRHPVRKGEEAQLVRWLQQEQLPYQKLNFTIEGGDVLLDENTVYVGISQRTTKEAVHELIGYLPNYEFKMLPIDKKFLHLDCVLNILSQTEALIYSPAFLEKDKQMLAERYQLIEVTPEEQFSLGTNILSLGNRKVISLPTNQQVNASLRQHGYEVIEIDFSEIIKSGGSFRCCSMPLLRDYSKI